MQLPSLSHDDAVVVGALVCTQGADTPAQVFIAASGGGVKLNISGVDVQVVTPHSPLGEALLGKRAGDTVELLAGGKKRELEILSVS